MEVFAPEEGEAGDDDIVDGRPQGQLAVDLPPRLNCSSLGNRGRDERMNAAFLVTYPQVTT